MATQSSGEIVFAWEHGTRRFAADGTALDGEELESSVGIRPDVAMNDQGNIVVVGAVKDVRARLLTFDDVAPPSGIFIVNNIGEGIQRHPSVAMDATGSFVVAFASKPPNIPEESIWLRRYAPDGTPLGDQQLVSDPGSLRSEAPQVAMRPGGEFAVVWQRGGPAIRFYGADGAPTTEPTFLNTAALALPHLAYAPSGALLVAYNQANGISGHLFDADGQVVAGPIVLVEADPSLEMTGPAVTGLASGAFHLTWFQNRTGEDPDVYSRRIAADGTPEGTPIRVHSATEGQQKWPDIAAVGEEPIIVFNDPDGDRSGVSAACFSADGCVDVFMDGFESGGTTAWSGALP